MDNAKQFAYYPVAVLQGRTTFTNGTISVKFKTVAGDADRASGILFNVKPNGDWLAVRYNDTENNVALWEFHNGIRRADRSSAIRDDKFMLDRAAWHELKMTVDGRRRSRPGSTASSALEYTLGSEPGPGRNGAPPNPDLFPENNPVLRPPVDGPRRAVVEDRQHQLLQRLRRQPEVSNERAHDATLFVILALVRARVGAVALPARRRSPRTRGARRRRHRSDRRPWSRDAKVAVVNNADRRDPRVDVGRRRHRDGPGAVADRHLHGQRHQGRLHRRGASTTSTLRAGETATRAR